MNTPKRSIRWLSSFIAGLVAATVLFAGSATAAEAPKAFIKQQTEEVTTLLAEEESEERARKFSKKAQALIDFEMLASRALGKHWEKRNEEEREQFLTHLQDLLEANYKRKLEGNTVGEDYEIEYLDVKKREDRAFVKTRVKWGPTDKERKPVSYKLVRKSDGWIVYDVVIDDISLESTYRESYTEIIEKEGWDALIDKMEKKIEELRKKAESEDKTAENAEK